MATGDNIRRHRKAKGLTQAQLADAVGLTEGAIRHYESGIRAVKPELLEEDYGVVPSKDGMGLAVDPRAPHAPKLAQSIKSWAEKRAELEHGVIDAAAYADWKASF